MSKSGLILVLYMMIMGCDRNTMSNKPVPQNTNSNTTINASAPKSIDVYVDSKRVKCVGVAPQMCLRIKKDPNDEWQLFYSTIKGFDYQEGFIYKLKVNTFNVPNPPADGSSIRYELNEVVSKTAVES